MQNFTLGKKGISMLFFAFILLIGSSPTFGQTNCPSLTDTSPGDFCYLSTIEDLTDETGATVTTGDVAWYRSLTSTTPIPGDELLESGDYFAGNDSGTCGTSRVEVSVTVDDIGAPTTQFGNTFAPCEYDTADVSTVQDLIDNVDGLDDNVVEIFAEEYGETALDPNENLVEGNSYFAGQINPDTGCRTSRIALRYDPVLAEAPTGDDVQIFCEGATVDDLEADPTSADSQGFRWYSTLTSDPALDSSTPLVDGEIYYASQIVNRDNSELPPCESEDRFAVTVTVNPIPDAPTADAFFCAVDNPTVADLDADGENLTWYEDSDLTIEATDSNPLANGDVFYVTQTVNECVSPATEVTVTVDATPTAPGANDQELCEGQTFEELIVTGIDAGNSITFYSDSDLLLPVDPSDEVVSGTYFVTQQTENSECESASTEFDVLVNPIPDAPAADVEQEFCPGDDPSPTVDDLTAPGSNLTWYTDAGLSNVADPTAILTDGAVYYVTETSAEGCESEATVVTAISQTDAPVAQASQVFCSTENPTVADLDATGQGLIWYEDAGFTNPTNDGDALVDGEDYFVTQTIDGCESETTQVTVTIEDIPAAPGADTTQDLCEGQTIGELDVTGENITFYSDQDLDNQLESSVQAVDNTTYYATQTSSAGCESTAVAITVTVNPTPDAGGSNTATQYCGTSEADVTFDSADSVEDFYLTLLGETAEEGGTFSTSFSDLAEAYSENNFQTFTTTYTVTNEAGCEDEAVLSVDVVEQADAEAGTFEQPIVVCTGDTPLDLNTLLSDDATPEGTFFFTDEPEDVITDGIFDPSSYDATTYNITYSVNEEAFCVTPGTSDFTTFDIEVLQSPNAPDITETICITEVQGIQDNPSPIALLQLLSDLDWDGDLGGDISPAPQVLIDQIEAYIEDTDRPEFLLVEATYTVTNAAGCIAVSEIEITIEDLQDAEAGTFQQPIVVCSTEDAFDLNNFLSADATTGGVFTDEEGDVITNGMFDPSDYTGDEEITYFVDDSADCVIEGSPDDSETFTITVVEPTAANAGGNFTVNYCASQDEDIDLMSLILENDDTANTFGSFSAPFEDGTFNPSVVGADEYVITYTINGAEDCAIGTENATITITVDETPDAPVADAEQFFCLVADATVANLDAAGENVVWYEDAGLTTEATPTDDLVGNATYYAVAVSDNGCESDVTEVTVSIQDADAPTLQTDGDEFCRGDNPTVQDLADNLTGENIQIYETSSGGTPIATSTALENGATYYATATNSSSECESSERISVTVDVAFCGIPEAFSPNGDNINDEFVIPEIATDFPNYSIEIFNRWGNVVFEGNASTGDWDGTNNQSTTMGEGVLPAGVYFYILNYNDGQTSPVQGKVYLSR